MRRVKKEISHELIKDIIDQLNDDYISPFSSSKYFLFTTMKIKNKYYE